MQNASMGPWNIISMSSVIYRVKSTSRSVLSLKCQKLTAASFHNCQPLLYKEDYTRLGIPQNATKDEIKSAYFVKAKQLHPDTHSRLSIFQMNLNLAKEFVTKYALFFELILFSKFKNASSYTS